MKNAITTTLDSAWIQYLSEEAKKQHTNRNTIIENALKLYQSVHLAQQIQEGLMDRQDEYRSFAKEFEIAQKLTLKKS